jgi:hypothetical protein
MKLLLAMLIACVPCGAQIRLVFVPDSDQFADAAREYREIWARESAKIIVAVEKATGLKFEDREVKAMVLEVSSDSGYKDESPMHLRASYPPETKKATLIHELGHRLEVDYSRRAEDDHKVLFLWLYDVWVKLYGQQFADAQVAVEKQRGRMYPGDWEEALAMSPEERLKQWKAFVEERRPR